MSAIDSNLLAPIMSIVGVVISSLISIVIAVYFGPRHVEKQRMKREHSIKLMNEALKPWRDQREQHCKVDSVYSNDTDRFQGVSPEDPKELVLFDAVEAHLHSGHVEVLDEWKTYKRAVFQHNQNMAEFLERVRTEIASSIDLPQYHLRSRQKEPDEYIISENAAQDIYHSLRYESINGREWGGRPSPTATMQPDGSRYYELRTSNYVIGKARHSEAFNSMIRAMIEIQHSKTNKRQIDQFVKREQGELKDKEKQFEEKTNELIRSIELGNCIKGKCKYCP